MLKGLPWGASRGCDAIGMRLLDDDLALPVAILHGEAIEHNATWMADFAGALGLSLAPHGKTTMSIDLFALQRRLDAWGMTAATAHHARLYADWGVRRILIANQIVGRANLAILSALLRRDPDLELLCLVDSVAGVAALDAALAGLEGRLRVLLECGAPGQRAGVRSVGEALAVANACASAPALTLAGVECFEGVHADAQQARHLLDHFVDCIDAVGAAGHFGAGEVIVSAGGSLFFDSAARAMLRAAPGLPARLVLRSGCYLTHDHGMYARAFDAIAANPLVKMPTGGLRPALEIWAHVQSRPEPGRAIASLGKRDASSDVDLPVPILTARPGRDARPRQLDCIRVAKLFDQHACLDVPPDHDLAVGDLIGFGISHPCTTFDKWRNMLVVDQNYCVVGDVGTCFG